MPYPYYPNYNQMLLQQQLQSMQQPQPPQIQNGGFVSAPSIEYAQNYSVAPGNSVTFKIESQPYICTKTLGFSQLDQPVFEIYRLVKEDLTNEEIKADFAEKTDGAYLSIEEGEKLKSDLNSLKEEINFLKEILDDSTKGDEK